MNERIGRCGWCGLVDHHLVDETCPACREKLLRQEALPRPERTCHGQKGPATAREAPALWHRAAGV
ncbi:MAG TPA: hypothetical protein EYP40_04420 [Chromatiales bacterium]|nr:hypothetical protein [Chromatiales bacterium]